ncbi:hypothetical protein M3Y94_00127400 [Aphelenchoides besseyi]|nr:hypothetical protein M3Y94_00127400 [Aphelenchoides besseyi]KAI6237376.1 hypothetical protein M3Y95_00258400 [Aphelenchoides besseyi]
MPRARSRSAARNYASTSKNNSPDYNTSSIRQRWGISNDANPNDSDAGDFYNNQEYTPNVNEPRSPFQNFLAIIGGLWDVGMVFFRVVQWIVQKTGYWLGVLILPGIFGPYLALKKMFGRTKRTYYAAKYAQEQGYLEGVWPWTQHFVKKAFVIIVGLISTGKIDLTETVFGDQSTVNVQTPRTRRSTTRRSTTGRSKLNRRYSPTLSTTYSQAPTVQMRDSEEEDEEEEDNREADDTTSVSSLITMPVRRGYDLVKMVVDLMFLGVYALFGWTFGRYDVDQEGVVTRRQRGSRRSTGRRSTAGEDGDWQQTASSSAHHRYNLRSRNSPTKKTNQSRQQQSFEGEEESSSWAPWILIALIVLGFGFAYYNKAQEREKKTW